MLSLDGIMVAFLSTHSSQVPSQVRLSKGTLHFNHHCKHCTHVTIIANIAQSLYTFTTLLDVLLKCSLTTATAVSTPLRITTRGLVHLTSSIIVALHLLTSCLLLLLLLLRVVALVMASTTIV